MTDKKTAQEQVNQKHANRLAQEVLPPLDIIDDRSQEVKDVEKAYADGKISAEHASNQLNALSYPTEEDTSAQLAGFLPEYPQEDYSTQALVPVESVELQTVEGLRFAPVMTEEEKEDLYESVSSYIGVTPKAPDEYIGQWLECKGAVVQPIINKEIDESTGEEITREWVKPLFKIVDGSKEVIIGGGGKYGLEFARNMTHMFGAGDWKLSRMIRITQENRAGVNRQTGQSEPHRLYRFDFKSMRSYQKMIGK